MEEAKTETLGEIKIGKNRYQYYTGFRDLKTGKFAKSGERYFDFTKLTKSPNYSENGLYQIVKHKDMSSFGVKTGRTISKSLYYARKTPVKAGLIGTATLIAGYGLFSLYNKFKKKNDEVDLAELQYQKGEIPVVQKNDNNNQIAIGDSTQTKPVCDYDSLHIVQKGDNIWNINKDRLKKNNEKPINERISVLTNETIRKNPKAKDNGNLIYPGDTLVMPRIDYEL